jgi:hypothetical protein
MPLRAGCEHGRLGQFLQAQHPPVELAQCRAGPRQSHLRHLTRSASRRRSRLPSRRSACHAQDRWPCWSIHMAARTTATSCPPRGPAIGPWHCSASRAWLHMSNTVPCSASTRTSSKRTASGTTAAAYFVTNVPSCGRCFPGNRPGKPPALVVTPRVGSRP